jgi:hypothetical protein
MEPGTTKDCKICSAVVWTAATRMGPSNFPASNRELDTEGMAIQANWKIKET